MTKEEIDLITKAFHQNYDLASSRHVAAIATIVDLLRGDVKGVQSPLSNLALGSSPDAAVPQPVDEDPNPIAMETLTRMGALGMQSLSELKGYRLDDSKRILLFINGRYADSGWVSPDPHMGALETIMRESGVPFSILP